MTRQSYVENPVGGAYKILTEPGGLNAPKPKDIFRQSHLQKGIILAYSIAVAIAIFHHEPWADEAQAWLIAKCLPFGKMLFGQVRYEGTPGLWHCLLWILSHAGLPYHSMLWLSGAIAVCGCWFLITYSPFPLAIRALIPFTFYFCYQFAVVARSYVLMPVLVFTAVHLIRIKSGRAVLFGIVAGLLANCNVFGLFLSFGLLVTYALTVRQEGRILSSFTSGPVLRSAVTYLLFAIFAIAVAFPPKDLRFVPTPLGDLVNRNRGVETPPPIGSSGFSAPLRQHMQDYTTPISHSLWMGILFLGAVVWQAWSQRKLIALIPLGFLVLSFELVYKMPRHMGIFLLTLIAIMWMTWPDKSMPLRRYRAADVFCTALFAFICLPQIAWSIRAIDFDVTQNYSGAKECAEFLKRNAQGKVVYGYDYFTVAISPYFDKPVFRNQMSQYWSWSKNNRNDLEMNRIVTERPDYVVLGWHQNAQFGFLISSTLSPSVGDMRSYLRDTQYERIARFEGSQVMRSSFAEKDFFEVYRRPELTAEEWDVLQSDLKDSPRVQR